MTPEDRRGDAVALAGDADGPEGELVGFGRELRREGLAVGPGRIVEFCRAAELLAPDDLYWAGLATLIGRNDDIPTYDDVFVRYFGAPPTPEELKKVKEHFAGGGK